MNSPLTTTENGALQLRSSGNKCLDLFAEVGSARNLCKTNQRVVEHMFIDAYCEDPATAVAILYWARAARGGAGERDVFHVLHNVLFGLSPETVRKNLHLIAKYGYFKDYVRIYDAVADLRDDVVDIFAGAVKEGNHYACKWLPRRHALHGIVRRKLGMANGEFRRHLAKHAKTVEQQLCAGKLAEVDYSKIPSLAFNLYKKMFTKKDRERFLGRIQESKVNAGVLMPHQVFPRIARHYTEDEAAVIEAQWKALPNYITEGNGIITVLDTSASMIAGYGIQPYVVAYPLALYCASKLEGTYKDQIIEFSSRPAWINLSKCESTAAKMEKLVGNTIVDSTDIQKVFELILNRATATKTPAEQMPTCVLILSDMQFDSGAAYDTTLMDEIRLKYKYAGYRMPTCVYWNLNALNRGVADNENCALISGFSPAIMKAVLACKVSDVRTTVNPMEVMEKALEEFRKDIDTSAIALAPNILKWYDLNPTRGKDNR